MRFLKHFQRLWKKGDPEREVREIWDVNPSLNEVAQAPENEDKIDSHEDVKNERDRRIKDAARTLATYEAWWKEIEENLEEIDNGRYDALANPWTGELLKDGALQELKVLRAKVKKLNFIPDVTEMRFKVGHVTCGWTDPDNYELSFKTPGSEWKKIQMKGKGTFEQFIKGHLQLGKEGELYVGFPRKFSLDETMKSLEVKLEDDSWVPLTDKKALEHYFANRMADVAPELLHEDLRKVWTDAVRNEEFEKEMQSASRTKKQKISQKPLPEPPVSSPEPRPRTRPTKSIPSSKTGYRLIYDRKNKRMVKDYYGRNPDIGMAGEAGPRGQRFEQASSNDTIYLDVPDNGSPHAPIEFSSDFAKALGIPGQVWLLRQSRGLIDPHATSNLQGVSAEDVFGRGRGLDEREQMKEGFEKFGIEVLRGSPTKPMRLKIDRSKIPSGEWIKVGDQLIEPALPPSKRDPTFDRLRRINSSNSSEFIRIGGLVDDSLGKLGKIAQGSPSAQQAKAAEILWDLEREYKQAKAKWEAAQTKQYPGISKSVTAPRRMAEQASAVDELNEAYKNAQKAWGNTVPAQSSAQYAHPLKSADKPATQYDYDQGRADRQQWAEEKREELRRKAKAKKKAEKAKVGSKKEEDETKAEVESEEDLDVTVVSPELRAKAIEALHTLRRNMDGSENIKDLENRIIFPLSEFSEDFNDRQLLAIATRALQLFHQDHPEIFIQNTAAGQLKRLPELQLDENDRYEIPRGDIRQLEATTYDVAMYEVIKDITDEKGASEGEEPPEEAEEEVEEKEKHFISRFNEAASKVTDWTDKGSTPPKNVVHALKEVLEDSTAEERKQLVDGLENLKERGIGIYEVHKQLGKILIKRDSLEIFIQSDGTVNIEIVGKEIGEVEPPEEAEEAELDKKFANKITANLETDFHVAYMDDPFAVKMIVTGKSRNKEVSISVTPKIDIILDFISTGNGGDPFHREILEKNIITAGDKSQDDLIKEVRNMIEKKLDKMEKGAKSADEEAKLPEAVEEAPGEAPTRDESEDGSLLKKVEAEMEAEAIEAEKQKEAEQEDYPPF